MKMRADRIEGQNAIARHGPGGVVVNGVEHTESVIVPWQGEVVAWNVDAFDALRADHFARIAALKPELVIFGSGARLRFPAPALLRPLIDARHRHRDDGHRRRVPDLQRAARAKAARSSLHCSSTPPRRRVRPAA